MQVGVDLGSNIGVVAWRRQADALAVWTDAHDDHPQAGEARQLLEGSREDLRTVLAAPLAEYQRRHGRVSAMTIAVPESWRALPSSYPVRLRQFVTEDLGLPPPRLVSVPTAAAAWCVHKAREQNAAGDMQTILVCVAGVRSFEAAYMTVRGRAVELVAVERSGDSEETWSRGAYTVALARHVLSQTGGADAAQDELTLAHTCDAVLRAIEKKDPETLRVLWTDAIFDDAPLYQVDGYSITVAEARSCFAPLAETVLGTLQRLHARLSASATIDQAAIIEVVGDFSPLTPARLAVFDALGIPAGDSRVVQPVLADSESGAAVALGAALIGEGAMAPIQYYPYAVHTVTTAVRAGHLVRDTIDLTATTGLEIGGFVPHGMEDPLGDDMPTVLIEETPARQVTIEVRSRRDDTSVAILRPQMSTPSAGIYRLGIQLHPSRHAWLVLRPTSDGPPVVHAIGRLP